MTNKTISITCASDDHVALRAFGNALEEMALANGAEQKPTTLVREKVGDHEIEYLTKETVEQRLATATNLLMEAAPAMLQDGKFDGAEVSGPRKSDQFPVDQWVEMVHPDETPTRLARSEAEIQQFTAEGWVIKTESFDELHEKIVKAHIETVDTPYVNLDKDGLPWDARIHAASKALNADETWRVRRKPKDMEDDAWAQEIESVRAELKQLMAIEGPTAEEIAYLNEEPSLEGQLVATEHLTILPPPVTIEPPVTPPGDDFHTDAGVVTETTVAGITTVAPPTVEAMTFPKLMVFLTERHSKITLVQVNELVAKHGLTNIQQFAQRPDLIGAFVADVKTLLRE